LFFELFWLDIIPVGTFIPPLSLFSTLASLLLIHVLGVYHPAKIALVMFATVPFASLGAWVEAKQRSWQNREFNMLVISTRRGHANAFAPGKFIHKGIMHTFFLQAFFCCVSLFFLFGILKTILPLVHPYPWISWPVLWLLASMGGVLSLRFRRAPCFWGCGVLGIAGGLWMLAVL